MKHAIKISIPFLEKFDITKFSELYEVKKMLIELEIPVKKVLSIDFINEGAIIKFTLMSCVEHFYLAAASNHYANNDTFEIEVSSFFNQERIELAFSHLVGKERSVRIPDFLKIRDYKYSDEEVEKLRQEELDRLNLNKK